MSRPGGTAPRNRHTDSRALNLSLSQRPQRANSPAIIGDMEVEGVIGDHSPAEGSPASSSTAPTCSILRWGGKRSLGWDLPGEAWAVAEGAANRWHLPRWEVAEAGSLGERGQGGWQGLRAQPPGRSKPSARVSLLAFGGGDEGWLFRKIKACS